MEDMTFGKIYIQNEAGSYSELGHITEAQIITDEIEPSDNSIGFILDDYSITMTSNRMSNKAVAAILGWRAKSPLRKRLLRKALWMRAYKEPEAIPWK